MSVISPETEALELDPNQPGKIAKHEAGRQKAIDSSTLD